MHPSNLSRITSSLVCILTFACLFRKWVETTVPQSPRGSLLCSKEGFSLPSGPWAVMCFGSSTRLSTEEGSECLARDLSFPPPESRGTAYGLADTATPSSCGPQGLTLVGQPSPTRRWISQEALLFTALLGWRYINETTLIWLVYTWTLIWL